MIDLPSILDLREDEDSALKAGLAQIARVRSHNELRQGYYELSARIRRISTVIPPPYYAAATALSWCTRSVDKLAERCNVDGAFWAGGDLAALGWDQIWRENYLRSEINAAITSSLIYGPAWMVVSQGDTESGEPDVLIHAHDAMHATGRWDTRLRALTDFVSITDTDDRGRPTGLVIMLPGRNVVCTRDGEQWRVDRFEHDFGLTVHPMPWKPMPGSRPFGRSRINASTMQTQDRAVRTLVRLEGLSDIYSFAELILLGADPSAFSSGDGTDSPWRRVMGRWKGLPDDADAEDPSLARAQIQEISGSSPDPHLAAFKLHAGIFAGETSLTMSDLGLMSEVNSSSADASENAEKGLVDLADASKDDWSPYLSRVLVDALAMKNGVTAGNIPSEWWSIAPKWRDSRFLSPSAAADAGLKLVQAAPELLQTSVGLRKLGLTQQEIETHQAELRRVQGRAVAAQIGTAARAAREQQSSSTS